MQERPRILDIQGVQNAFLFRRESGETLCVEGFLELRQDTRVFALERMQELEVIED